MTVTCPAKNGLTTISVDDLMAKPFPKREVILGPWLRQEETALIWAATGVGKTMLTLSIAIAVACGGKLWEWEAPKARKVWIIDGEMHLQDLQDRIRMLGSAAVSGHDPKLVGRNLQITARQAQSPDSVFFDITDKAHQDAILAKCKLDGIELLIIDNLSTVADGLEDENEATAFRTISSFMTRMKQAGVATILVHHARKDGQEPRGSTALQTTFEVIIGLKRPSVPVHGKASFVTTFGKFRGLGSNLTEARTWTLGETGWIVDEDAEDFLNVLMAALEGRQCATQGELADRLGVSPAKISRELKKLVALGRITRDGIKAALGEARELREIDTGQLDTDFDPEVPEY